MEGSQSSQFVNSPAASVYEQEEEVPKYVKPQPVVFKDVSWLPNYQAKPVPVAEHCLTYAKILYYPSPDPDNSGHYELVKLSSPDVVIKLYANGMRNLLSNMEAALSAAKDLENNLHLHDDNLTYEVATINSYGTVSNRLVVNTYRGDVFVNLKLYTVDNETKLVYPTRKAIRFSPKDDFNAVSDFLIGKR